MLTRCYESFCYAAKNDLCDRRNIWRELCIYGIKKISNVNLAYRIAQSFYKVFVTVINVILLLSLILLL